MKKILNLAVAAVASMALLSCEKKDGPVAYAEIGRASCRERVYVSV